MTLAEYINQTDPVRMPEVILERSEITVGTTISIAGGTTLTSVWITDGVAKICWGKMYVVKNDDRTLYTTDSDGNPKSRSCFQLNNLNALKPLA